MFSAFCATAANELFSSHDVPSLAGFEFLSFQNIQTHSVEHFSISLTVLLLPFLRLTGEKKKRRASRGCTDFEWLTRSESSFWGVVLKAFTHWPLLLTVSINKKGDERELIARRLMFFQVQWRPGFMPRAQKISYFRNGGGGGGISSLITRYSRKALLRGTGDLVIVREASRGPDGVCLKI